MTYGLQRVHGEVVEVDPDGTLPVVLSGAKELIASGQGSKTERCPELVGIVHQVKDVAKLIRLAVDNAQEHGEQRDVSLVADLNTLVVLVDCHVAVSLLFFAPVQIYEQVICKREYSCDKALVNPVKTYHRHWRGWHGNDLQTLPRRPLHQEFGQCSGDCVPCTRSSRASRHAARQQKG